MWSKQNHYNDTSRLKPIESIACLGLCILNLKIWAAPAGLEGWTLWTSVWLIYINSKTLKQTYFIMTPIHESLTLSSVFNFLQVPFWLSTLLFSTSVFLLGFLALTTSFIPTWIVKIFKPVKIMYYSEDWFYSCF